MDEQHYVYILRCKDQSLYTGYTNDLAHRLKMHESGKGAKYTRGRGPFEVMYVQTFTDKSEAMQEEYRIKRLSRKQKLECIRMQKEVFGDEHSKEL